MIEPRTQLVQLHRYSNQKVASSYQGLKRVSKDVWDSPGVVEDLPGGQGPVLGFGGGGLKPDPLLLGGGQWERHQQHHQDPKQKAGARRQHPLEETDKKKRKKKTKEGGCFLKKIKRYKRISNILRISSILRNPDFDQ